MLGVEQRQILPAVQHVSGKQPINQSKSRGKGLWHMYYADLRQEVHEVTGNTFFSSVKAIDTFSE